MSLHFPLGVSPCGHFFRQADGSPFYYLADTVWMLFNKLTIEEAERFFADRAKKGFTVIQAVVFRDLFEPNTPKVDGVRPFATDADMRAARLNPAWLDHVAAVTKLAADYGLVMGLLPTWGDKWNEHSNSAGPVIMDRDSAKAYCRTLSDAMGACDNVIWILGGDSQVQNQLYADTIRAMAEGLRAGAGADRLITFHPSGMGSSSIFHAEPWLDFNALQTSHYKPNVPNYLYIERLYHTQPPKPCMDLEPNYESAPMFAIGRDSFQPPAAAVFNAYDVRKAYYRSVLAGAAGFTYGCEPIRQLIRPGDRIHLWDGQPMAHWTEALAAPGSAQLGLLKRLLLERRYETRVPAQELFIPMRHSPPWPDRMAVGLPFAGQENTDPAAHVSVARCREGSYLLAYLPVRSLVNLDTSHLASDRLRLRVYDPAACACVDEGELDNPGVLRYVPAHDLDAFIVVDAV